MAATVDTRCAAYDRLCSYWDLPERLYMGTKAMREASTKYLPRMHGENAPAGSVNVIEDPYYQRLELTFLYNAYKHSIHGLRGKVFSNPVEVTAESDGFYKGMSEEVDLEASDINTFAMDSFVNAMHYGLVYFLVDFPQQQSDGNRVITLYDNKVSGAKPFFVCLTPKQVIGWRTEQRAGKRVLTQFRFIECVTENDGEFGETEIEQVRVFYPDRSEIWRKTDSDKEYALYATYKNSLGYIPVECYYTQRIGYMQAISPLFDLATKNLEHWQHSSMQQLASHAARSLILFGSGFEAAPIDPATGRPRPLAKLQIGMHQMITVENPQATLQYLQFPIDALRYGEEKLATLKDEMAVLALGPILQQRPGSMTATEKSIDTAQAQSILWTWAMSLKIALERAFEIAGEWAKKSGKVDVAVNTDFGIPTEMGPELDVLYKSVSGGQLSRETFWSELRRRDVLMDSFDAEIEEERLMDQGESLGMMGRDSVARNNNQGDQNQNMMDDEEMPMNDETETEAA